jgi:hypothetical protein
MLGLSLRVFISDQITRLGYHGLETAAAAYPVLTQDKIGFSEIQEVPDFIGAPDTIRTCDLCLRRAALYPAELRMTYLGPADAVIRPRPVEAVVTLIRPRYLLSSIVSIGAADA